jgi:fucose 4-O-acetylase-like acetyltransferase
MLKNYFLFSKVDPSINYDLLQSKTMDWLRFPLMVLVMLIHVDMQNFLDMKPSVFAYGIFFTITQIIARIAVPLFFIISGYFFFYGKGKTPIFNKDTYLSKLKKRAKTLLIPYLFWNLVICCILIPYYVLAGRIDLSFSTIASAFFSFGDTGYPIAFQFWFIRDLMIVVIVSPIVYILIRYLKIFSIILLFLFWTSPLNIEYLPKTAIFFFSLGAYFSVNNLNIIKTIRVLPKNLVFLITFVLMVADLLINSMPMDISHGVRTNLYLHNIFLLFGITSALLLVAKGIETSKLKTNKLLASCSFFMFAIHPLPLVMLGKIAVKVLPHNDLTFLINYFVPVIIVAVISVVLYKFLKRYFPRLTSIITGSR